jgi:TolA-binding protein
MKSILLCLSVLVAFQAVAQPTKPEGELETGETAAKDVFRPEEDAETKAAIDPERERIDAVVAQKEVELSKVRQRQIADMRKILRENPLYKKKADLLFRIAEKEWDEAKYRYFLARKSTTASSTQASRANTLKKKPEEPVADYSKALDEYKALLKEFPNYERIDEVMFYLGRGLIAADKKKEGASYMLRLTKDYPKSKYVTRRLPRGRRVLLRQRPAVRCQDQLPQGPRDKKSLSSLRALQARLRALQPQGVPGRASRPSSSGGSSSRRARQAQGLLHPAGLCGPRALSTPRSTTGGRSA